MPLCLWAIRGGDAGPPPAGGGQAGPPLWGEIAVNASIYNFQGLSSHADQDHLLQWIDQVKDPAPQQIFLWSTGMPR